MIKYTDHNITEIDPKELPSKVPIITLRNAVVLPGMLLPIFVGRSEALELLEAKGKTGALIGLFTQIRAEDEEINLNNIYQIGTLGEIHKISPLSDGGCQVLLQGIQKIKLEKIIQTTPYLIGEILPLIEIIDHSEEGAKKFQNLVINYVETNPNIPNDVIKYIKKITNPSALANQIIFFSQRNIEDRINFLKIYNTKDKINYLSKELEDETNRLKLEIEVQELVEKDTNKMQKEFYLRKQLETIRKELGENDDEYSELEDKLTKKFLPENIRKLVNKELNRLRRISSSNQYSGGYEVSQIRNWLELVADLIWEEPIAKNISLHKASLILDQDHSGLEEAKKRILEFLAVEKQIGGGRTMILCLVGPPGVGKTSLAKSIAKALDRPFVKASLGGIRDEAEIRGHRRTYVGAMEGKILKSMKRANTRDPVFLLDEIDKTNSSNQGDPSSALLEVLDPEQNKVFEDHFLGEPYDLSRVFFVCTANEIDKIPATLQDRMEIIRLTGYSLKEKIDIAQRFLLPRIIQEIKLEKNDINITENAIKKVIMAHTRESGVRELKRKLEILIQRSVRNFIEKKEELKDKNNNLNKLNNSINNSKSNENSNTLKINYDVNDILELLGRDKYYNENKENLNIPGVATGLVWTPVGGEILFVESTAYQGKGEIKLSGRLGEVIRESAQTAISFLKANAEIIGIDSKIFSSKDIHLHFPSGAVPKEGPSAGVTILVALTSLFTNIPLSQNLAMTGEISLRGKILPVGGVKEKVLAAKTAGISKVFLPEKNRTEFLEIPENIREGLEVLFFDNMLQLIFASIPNLSKLNQKNSKFIVGHNDFKMINTITHNNINTNYPV